MTDGSESGSQAKVTSARTRPAKSAAILYIIRGKIGLADRQQSMEFTSSLAIISTYHTDPVRGPEFAYEKIRPFGERLAS